MTRPRPERRIGPATNGTDPDVSEATKTLTRISPLDDIARHIDGTFVVVVKVTAGKYRRRCYLTAQAAENAARRATDRGETATVFLAELKPLWKLLADELVEGGRR